MGRGWTGFRRTLYKSFGVNEIGGVKNGLSFFDDERGLAMVEHGRSQQADAGMMDEIGTRSVMFRWGFTGRRRVVLPARHGYGMEDDPTVGCGLEPAGDR